MELLIGCGRNWEKKIGPPNKELKWENLVTLDINPHHNPTVVHDLNDIPLPFEDDSFDEIHAYEVLEHCGQQGDYEFFFRQWSDFWRILKTDGYFFGTSPTLQSVWSWGDPGHTRIVSKENFVFLNQPQYVSQIEKIHPTPMSDYRYIYKADFDPVFLEEKKDTFVYVLQAVKPSRIRGGNGADS